MLEDRFVTIGRLAARTGVAVSAIDAESVKTLLARIAALVPSLPSRRPEPAATGT